jgi:hypothetical protein
MTSVTGYPGEPPGLRLVRPHGPDGPAYLTYDTGHALPPGSPWTDQRRTRGWYYGYPVCCIQAFIERGLDTSRARLFHPVSGHMLCDVCARGARAPLPPRPAARYGFVVRRGPRARVPNLAQFVLEFAPFDDGGCVWDEPSGYDGGRA